MGPNRRTRPGFTLVELLVAAALSMVIMLIIGVAMQRSIDTFRTLRSVSQMQEKLKATHMVLRRDLQSEHFDAPPGGTANGGGGGPKLSQQRLDRRTWRPPMEGYFCIMQGLSVGGDPLQPGPQPYIFEGRDSDLLSSTRAVTHSLHFTSRLIPDPLVTSIAREENYFYARVTPGHPLTGLPYTTPVDFVRPNGTMFASRWAEVSYFLVHNGQTANGEPLFALHRRQRLLAPRGTPNMPWNAGSEQAAPDVSWGAPMVTTTGQRVNKTTDAPVRGYRTPLYRYTQPNNYGDIWRPYRLEDIPGLSIANPGVMGDDILLTDVLSFEVKVHWIDTQAATTANGASMPFENFNAFNGPAVNFDWPYAYLPTQNGGNPRNPMQYNNNTFPVRTFDTWSLTDGAASGPFPPVNWNNPTGTTGFNTPGANRAPLRICIDSLQIRIRVWDQAGQTARQITFVQDM